MPRGDRYPNQDSRSFRGLAYVKIRVFTLGESTWAPNSRIYDVGSLYSKVRYKVREVRGYANLCSMPEVPTPTPPAPTQKACQCQAITAKDSG